VLSASLPCSNQGSFDIRERSQPTIVGFSVDATVKPQPIIAESALAPVNLGFVCRIILVNPKSIRKQLRILAEFADIGG
jgi:hypothetical protein